MSFDVKNPYGPEDDPDLDHYQKWPFVPGNFLGMSAIAKNPANESQKIKAEKWLKEANELLRDEWLRLCKVKFGAIKG